MKNTILFDEYKAFVTEAAELESGIVEYDNSLVPELFHDYNYPISSWPILIPEELSEALKEICIKIPVLQRRIPELYFNNSIKEMADFYFNGDEMMTQFALMCHKKNVDVSCRLDLTYTQQGFKVLEINMGSSIGGMETQNFEPLVSRLHPLLTDDEVPHGYKYQRSQTIYLKFLVDKVLQYVKGDEKDVNIFIAAPQDNEAEFEQSVGAYFRNLYENELQARGLSGKAFTSNIMNLKLVGQQLKYEEQPIHGVLILDFALRGISQDLFRAFIMDKVYFPDHLGTNFLGDKRNLALLYRLASQGKFSPTDNAFILNCIPWTEMLQDRSVNYDDEDINLLQLLKEKKSELVIKIADGLQGDDVYIGDFHTDEEWQLVIGKTLLTNKYIVQQYCESVDFFAPGYGKEWKAHKVVWGAFGFGDIYGGVFGRMAAREQNKGVINCAVGAIETLIYRKQN